MVFQFNNLQGFIMNSINKIQKEAKVFLDHAVAITSACQSADDMKKVKALDANLKLWVEIETTLQSADNYLPQEIKDNLSRLSKFVEQLILSKGINMDAQSYECLANINMQISYGLLDAIKNHMVREDAFSLVKCAVDIAEAKDNNDEKALITALDNNLKLWVYIKSLAQAANSGFPDDLKQNLVKLADYVSSQTFRVGQSLAEENFAALDSLVKTNLQISDGLMAGQSAAKVA